MAGQLTHLLHDRLERSPDLIALILEQNDENELGLAYFRAIDTYLRDSGLETMMLLAAEDDLCRQEKGQEPLPDLGVGLPAEASSEIVRRWIESLSQSVAHP